MTCNPGQRKSHHLISVRREFEGLWNEKFISLVSMSTCKSVKYFVSSHLSSGHCLFAKLMMLEPSFNRSGLLYLCCCSERMLKPHAHNPVLKAFSWSSGIPPAGAKAIQLRKTSNVNVEIIKHLTHLEVEETMYDTRQKKGQGDWDWKLMEKGNWKGVLWLAEDSNYVDKVTRTGNWQDREKVAGQMKRQY